VLSADGNDQSAGSVTWDDWQDVVYAERLKPGAALLQKAFIALAP